MSVYGSQEGMTHIFLPLINPGDVVLLPNPGYPILIREPLWQRPASGCIL